MLDNPITSFTNSSKTLVCFSIGYFLFDTFNMISNGTRKWMEIIIHHICIIFGFGLTVTFDQFIAYTAFSLFVEINTVFLHGRTLLLLSNESKTSLRFKTVALINILTFIVFRLGVLFWMTWSNFSIRQKIPMFMFVPFSTFLLFLVSIKSNKIIIIILIFQDAHNLKLFYSLLAADLSIFLPEILLKFKKSS